MIDVFDPLLYEQSHSDDFLHVLKHVGLFEYKIEQKGVLPEKAFI